jgi:hypothetical protein
MAIAALKLTASFLSVCEDLKLMDAAQTLHSPQIV